MNRYFLKMMQGTLILLDVLAINIGYNTVNYFLRREFMISAYIEYNNFLYYLNGSWILVAIFCNLYKETNVTSFEVFSRVSIRAFLYFMGMLMVYLFFFRQYEISRIFLTVFLSSISLLLIFNRFIYLAIYQYFKKKDYLTTRIVILGYNGVAKKLVEYLEKEALNAEILGFCDEESNMNEITHYPWLNTIDNSLSICKMYNATDIYSTIAPEQNQKVYDVIRHAEQNCIRFRLIPDLGFFIKQKLYLDYIHDLPVISLRKEPLEDLGNRIGKRFFDVAASLFVAIFIFPILIPIIGLLIKLESKGPVFFKQLRSAKNNKAFYCLKFRSMYLNTRSDSEQASADDIRITRIGRFLRRTSLDEFPQFFNVLSGQMSIVGPRPHMIKHTDDYSKLLNKFMIRQSVKPGITGWAQIHGLRGETRELVQMEKRVEHDIWYMENWSIWLDIKIVFLTVFKVFGRDENAF
jgi:putative colanic acid biosysnthesis UDP-glucose lipid carrier transferase